MSTPPPAKRPRTINSGPLSPSRSTEGSVPAQIPSKPSTTLNTIPPPTSSILNPRKRAASRSPAAEPKPLNVKPPPTTSTAEREASTSLSIPALLSEDSGKKRGTRTNTPWTAVEEQRLKHMRDAGNTWSEIAKQFPNRTEGSVKKHWYKDMHYAEFAEDETKALLDAIKEYEANKWKVIGAKLGKPAKACEQFAKDHFKTP
ncbi:hypothetical protein LTR05_000358 [Lithohypha guttulata]|uniref:Uncharacterized protein n=1 Tax=Lithohypha guttulata TaxID=1690604 RepID=A0AAN7T556_9EURO|nr:hypothetical protein LTR05_000358 [Lithohypha guttulata]